MIALAGRSRPSCASALAPWQPTSSSAVKTSQSVPAPGRTREAADSMAAMLPLVSAEPRP